MKTDLDKKIADPQQTLTKQKQKQKNTKGNFSGKWEMI